MPGWSPSPGRLAVFLACGSALLIACASASAPADRAAGGAERSSALGVLVATVTAVPTLPAPTAVPAATAAAPLPAQTPFPTPSPPTPAPPAPPLPTATPNPTSTPDGSPPPAPTPTAVLAVPLSGPERYVYEAQNEERSRAGLPPLSLDPALEAIARARAHVMAANELFSHYSPGGQTVFDLMAAAGYAYGDASENIHFNTNVAEADSAPLAMSHFMASPGHRLNILKPRFRRVGVAMEMSAGGVFYYSVVFSD